MSVEVGHSSQDLGEGMGHTAYFTGENIDVAEIASDQPETGFHMKFRSNRAQPVSRSRRVTILSIEGDHSSQDLGEGMGHTTYFVVKILKLRRSSRIGQKQIFT